MGKAWGKPRAATPQPRKLHGLHELHELNGLESALCSGGNSGSAAVLPPSPSRVLIVLGQLECPHVTGLGRADAEGRGSWSSRSCRGKLVCRGVKPQIRRNLQRSGASASGYTKLTGRGWIASKGDNKKGLGIASQAFEEPSESIAGGRDRWPRRHRGRCKPAWSRNQLPRSCRRTSCRLPGKTGSSSRRV